MKWGWIPLMCAVGLSACAAWQIREPLGVTIADIKPLGANVLEVRYAVKVRVLNPNDTDIAFDGVAFDLDINGKPFAKAVSSQTGVIPRFGETLIDLQVVSGLQDILRQIVEFQKGDRAGFTYRIKGRLHSAGAFGAIPFSTSGEFALPAGGKKPAS